MFTANGFAKQETFLRKKLLIPSVAKLETFVSKQSRVCIWEGSMFLTLVPKHFLVANIKQNLLPYVSCAAHVDYEQSLFPLRDSRGKRTSERARKSPASLKRDARVEPLVSVVKEAVKGQPRWLSLSLSFRLTTLAARHVRHVSTRRRFRPRSFVRFPRLSLSGKRDCS